MSHVYEAMRRARGGEVAGPAAADPVEPGNAAPLRATTPPPAGDPAASALVERNAGRVAFADAAVPTLGADKLFALTATSPLLVEQARKAAAALHLSQSDRGLKILMVVSAVAGEGKTFVAANVALTLSESYQRRVLLIDSDLRRPRLHEVLDVPNGEGWSDALTGPPAKMHCQRVTSRLSVMTAGRATDNPMHVLTAARMGECLAALSSAFDWVIMDTTPAASLPDANLLAPHVDAAVLVVCAGRTPLPMVQRAINAVGRERIIGVVLNQADAATLEHDHYSPYYTYADRPLDRR